MQVCVLFFLSSKAGAAPAESLNLFRLITELYIDAFRKAMTSFVLSHLNSKDPRVLHNTGEGGQGLIMLQFSPFFPVNFHKLISCKLAYPVALKFVKFPIIAHNHFPTLQEARSHVLKSQRRCILPGSLLGVVNRKGK